MAVTSFIEGLFVSAKETQWDAFPDERNPNRMIEGGEALSVLVYTTDDKSTETVRYSGDHLSAAREMAKSLDFGVRVRIACGERDAKKRYKGYRIELADAKPVRAAG